MKPPSVDADRVGTVPFAHIQALVAGLDPNHTIGHDAVKDTDALITEPIQDLSWDMRGFQVMDPDGNKLNFRAPLPP